MDISNYLGLLKRYLGRKLPQDILDSRLREIETHLQQAKLDSGSEERATARMGSPKVLARKLVRSAKGYDTIATGRLVRWVGPMLGACLIIPYLLMQLEFIDPTKYQLDYYSISAWSSWIAILTLGVQVVLTRRWLVRALIPWLAGAVVIMLIGVFGSTLYFVRNPTMATIQAHASYVRSELRSIESDQRLLATWNRGQPPTKNNRPVGLLKLSTDIESNTVLPFIPVHISGHSKRDPGTEPQFMFVEMTQRDAERSWKEFGSSVQNDLNLRRQLVKRKPATDIDFGAALASCSIVFVSVVLGLTLWAGCINGSLLLFLSFKDFLQHRSFARIAK